MKIQLASDLHLETLGPQLKLTTLIEPAPGADLLVLAGDIGSGIDAIQRFADWAVPVIYVAGNHEFYDRSWDQTRVDLRDACQASGIHFLDNGILEIGGTRILGSTLWTDFRVDGYTQRKCMEEAELRINDFYRIQTQAGPLRALQTVEDHEMSRRWLQRELARPFKGKTIVVTHHAPHPLSIAPRYAGTALNGAFASDLSDLLEFASLTSKRDAKVPTLSGGMKRRLTLARALVNDPDVIFLDEPTTGLDPQARHLIWQRLRELTSQGKTLLLTTHFMDEAERLCHRLAVMDNGKLISQGTPRELIERNIEPQVVEVFGEHASDWAAANAAQYSQRAEVSGETVFCYVQDAQALVAHLQTQGDLRYLHRPANLEDVFLKLTGREMRE